MGSSTTILLSVLFSSIGIGVFMYGKKQRAIVPLCVGLALIFYPYFIASAIMLVIVGIVLIAIPYFVRF
jgi:uncharacterized membrane protein